MSSSDYANRLFKEWGVGQAKTDNGVLVVVAIDDRDMAIEVGYGLEGVLARRPRRTDHPRRLHAALQGRRLLGRHSQWRDAPRRCRRETAGPDAGRARAIQRRQRLADPVTLYRRAVLRRVRGDWVRDAWRRPAQQDGVPGVVRQLVRRPAAAHEPDVTRQAVADDAVSLCARDAGRRLSPRRQAGVARRVPQHGGKGGRGGSSSGGWTMGGGSSRSGSSSSSSSSGGSFGGGSSGGGGASGKW